jgi:hypothetical protein
MTEPSCQEPGVPLAGGRMTTGIVRHGAQLRRPTGAWTPAVHEFLHYLESAGFDGSPRVLGVEQEWEILTFLDGEVAVDPHWRPGHGHRLPAYARADRALREAGGLIRRLHDAAAGFEPANVGYRFDPRPPRPGEIVSHGDIGPWNTVYRDGVPAAFIDWDASGPVEPLLDLADAAWVFVPLTPGSRLREAGFDPLPDLVARLRLFLDGYGVANRQQILPALRRARLTAAERIKRGPIGTAGTAGPAGPADPAGTADAAGALTLISADLRWLDGVAAELARGL